MTLRTFQARVVMSFLLLIMLVQTGSLIAVTLAIERSARTQVKAELTTAAKVVGRLIEARKERLVEAARILSADFPFKQVVALDDRETLLSTMDNHRARIGAELMMVVSLDGTRIVDTLHRDPGTSGPGFLTGISIVVHAARQTGELHDFVLVDDRPFQVVVVPLLAPAPVAWIGMGFPIDQNLADELRTTTAAHVSFVHAESGNRWGSVTSTLPPEDRGGLLRSLSGRHPSSDRRSFELSGPHVETLVIPLASSLGGTISVALQRSIEDAMEPYRYLRTALLVLLGVAACVSVVGGVWVGRGVSRPVRELADAARQIEAGRYGGRVAMTRHDELGDLAATFNRMTSAVAEREERLRESEERFRAMTESAEDGIVTADSEGHVVSWNRGARAIFGWAEDEALGMPLAHLVPERYRDVDPEGRERLRAIDEMPATQGPVELHGLRKDGGEFPIELSLATWQTRQGSFRTAIIRDITGRRELEEQFRQAQKMESVGRLAGGVAHDFNNLLTVIMGHVELLKGQLGSNHPGQKRAGVIQQAATQAADLIRQLLAFSRKQVLAPRILDLDAVVAEVHPMLRRLIGDDITLVIVPTPDLRRVEADPVQITQIILNLAVNARDAMPQGGTLTIETGNVAMDAASFVMLAVTDTGIGMDEETRSHVFEPFFTTKEPGKGTGLGLATVYGIVKQSNGNIEVFSEPGRGTTFKIYLPRGADTTEAVTADRAPGKARGSETILLVEDNEMVRALARELLEGRGYTVLQARDGADALDITHRYDGTIHLLLTDMVMPGMSGRDLAARLLPARRLMKVLYMSGYAPDPIVHEEQLDARAAFVPKPIAADTLLGKVRELLDAPIRSDPRARA